MIPIYHDEVQLMSWGESDTQGAWIKLRLPDSDALGPFRGMTKSKGDRAGQRLACTMVEIGDDEQAVQQQPEFDDIARSLAAKRKEAVLARDASGFKEECEKAEDSYELKGGEYCRLSAIWCKDPVFQDWIERLYKTTPDIKIAKGFSDKRDDLAAESVRLICGVNSRRELDHDAAAARVFNDRIRVPFMKYLEKKR